MVDFLPGGTGFPQRQTSFASKRYRQSRQMTDLQQRVRVGSVRSELQN